MYLADWIIEHFPARCKNSNAPKPDDPGWCHYVEPFFGGGSVLLANDPTGISEVANDLNSGLSTFWGVMASDNTFPVFQRIVENTPFSQGAWESRRDLFEWCRKQQSQEAGHLSHSRPAMAAAFFIFCRQSMSGRMKSFAPLTRNRTRQGMNEQAAAWWSAVDGLPEIHARLKRVVILNRPAVEVIRQQDGARSLFYCDPPYVHESRKTTKEYGDHEMSAEQHRELLETLASIKGRFVLSGYPSKLYAEFAKRHGWNTDVKRIDNKSSKADAKEIKDETLWMNF
jgi:DNA adenine methylase